MRFITSILKLIFISFIGTLSLYVLECIKYESVIDFISFMKTFYPYIFFIIMLAMIAKEKIDH